MKPFQSQIRLNKFNVDEAQRHLGELQRLGDQLRAQRSALEEEAKREQALAASSLEASIAYPGYARQLIERRARLDRSIEDVEAQILQAREGLANAFAELKKFELAAEAAEERNRKKREQRDQIAMDEVAIQIFRKKQG